jgi:hypothetical protein
MKLKIACLSLFLFIFSYNLGSNTKTNMLGLIQNKTIIATTTKSSGKTINIGLRRPDGSFRKFKDPQSAFNALKRDIEIKQSGNSQVVDSNSTLKEFINIYVPQVENNTKKYLNILADSLNVHTHIEINKINPFLLAKFILMLENRKIYNVLFKTKTTCVSQTEN